MHKSYQLLVQKEGEGGNKYECSEIYKYILQNFEDFIILLNCVR